MAWISRDIGQVLEEYSMEDAGSMKCKAINWWVDDGLSILAYRCKGPPKLHAGTRF
jgi:hypothetical protein